MNPPNKKSPDIKGINQPFNQRATTARQFKPVVAQLKNAVSAQSAKQPVAPPVNRPQSSPIGLHSRAAAKQPSMGPVQSVVVAPPAHRHQSILRSTLPHWPKKSPDLRGQMIPRLAAPAASVIQRAAAKASTPSAEKITEIYGNLDLAGKKLSAKMKAHQIFRKINGENAKATPQQTAEMAVTINKLDSKDIVKQLPKHAASAVVVAAKSARVKEGKAKPCKVYAMVEGKNEKLVHDPGEHKALAELTPEMQEILRSVTQQEWWNIWHCAEVGAVDKIIRKEGSAAISKIVMYPMNPDGSGKPLCDNCKQWQTQSGGKATVKSEKADAAIALSAPAAAVAPH